MKFLSRKNILILIAITVVFLIVFSLNKPKEDNSGPQDQQKTEAPEYKNLELGQSSKEDAIENLGEPVNIKQENEQEILEYDSNNPNFNNQVLIENNEVSFVKEIITQEDQRTISSITDKYGQPDKVLYGPRSGVGFYLYVYPSKGIAYIGHQKSGILLEIWYFTPTTYTDFKTKYAKDYSESKQIIQ